MRAIAYCTLNRKGRYTAADSLQSMNSRFEAYCAEGGHVAAGTFAETSDDGERPRWDSMVSRIKESGLGYLVVVPSTDHLGATLEERIDRVLELDAMSCKVVCDDPEFPDALQNALRLQRGPGSRGERIRAGMLAKAAQGMGLGKTPYGYRLQVDGSLLVVEEEAEVVRSMFQSYAEGDGGVRAVAQALNDRGLRTRAGRRWSMITVRDILRNTAYVGTYRRFGLRMPSVHEPIVASPVFRRVQDLMRSRVPPRRFTKSGAFLLTGMIYCGHCGERMMGVTRRQAWRRKGGERVRGEYRYYQCQSRINRNQCAYRTVRAEGLEDEVLSAVRALFPLDGEVDAGARAVRTALQRKEAESRLAALSRKYAAAIGRAATGAINMRELRAAQEETAQVRRSLLDRLSRAGDGGGDGAALIEEERDKLHQVWDDIDVAERQEALRTLVSRVVVTDGHAEVVP